MANRRRRFGALRKLPSGRWQARYAEPSGRIRTAPETFTTRGDADRYLVRVEADLQRGEWRDPGLGKVTFLEWTNFYRAGAKKRATTMARDVSVLTTHLLPALGDRPLASITPLDVRRLVNEMERKLAPSTVRTNYGVLKAVLNAAVEADVIVRSPCRGVKLAPDTRQKRPTLSPADIERIASGLPVDFRPMAYVAGVLGLRWSEIAGLRVSRLNFLTRTLDVAETLAEVDGKFSIQEPKTQAGRRTIAVPAFLMDMLAEHLARRGLTAADADTLVFVGPKGGLFRRSNFGSRHWARAAKDAGFEGLTFHGLRHAATSLMVESGEHPRVIQHRLGHSTARLSMELYAHVSEGADRTAAAHLDARFSDGSGTYMARGAEEGG